MKKSGASQGQSASELISKRIAETRGLARGNPQQNAQAHQGSRPGRRRGVEVDGHSDLVARRHHLHWRILQECREAYLRQGRVSEGSGPSLQLESRRKRTPRDRHPRRRRSRRVRLQGARSPSGRPQQFWQVETFEESEVLRDSAPEQVRHRGGGRVVPPERTQVEDGLDSRKERIAANTVDYRVASRDDETDILAVLEEVAPEMSV